MFFVVVAAAWLGGWSTALTQPTRSTRRAVGVGAKLRSFQADEIVMQSFIGQIGVFETTDWEYSGDGVNPFSAAQPRRTTTENAKVRLFLGTLDDPRRRAVGEDVRVLLREYGSRDLASKELSNYETLEGGRFVRLLGSLEDEVFGGDSCEDDERFTEIWRANLGVDPPTRGSRWLVYEWVGLTTAQSVVEPSADFRKRYMEPRRELFGLRTPSPDIRRNYVLRVLRSSLEALNSLHTDGKMAHRSIGCASLALDSKLMDKTTVFEPSQLRVKLANFGYAEPLTLKLAAADIEALGYVFLLLLASPAFADYGDNPPPKLDQETLRRLYTEVLNSNLDELQKFFRAEEGWRGTCEFLDANDGWETVTSMLDAQSQDFSANPFGLLSCSRLLKAACFRPNY